MSIKINYSFKSGNKIPANLIYFVNEDFSITLEKGFDKDVIKSLEDRGHAINQVDAHYPGAQLIWKGDDCYCAASDHRKDGCAVGF